MKFNTENIGRPFLLDGHTILILTFEIGDVFIDSKNKIKYANNINGDIVTLIDESGNVSHENIQTKKFRKQFRYAGTIENNDFPQYSDAIRLF